MKLCEVKGARVVRAAVEEWWLVGRFYGYGHLAKCGAVCYCFH
jgi:hypothetical protein